MSATPVRDRRAERYEATRREILDAAWELVRREGLGALSLRELGARVGMRAQSLYVYFPSKHAIYDAMFGEGTREMWARLVALEDDGDPVANLRRRGRAVLEFCLEDPARYQLLMQRTIPGFEPSPDSYAPAVAILDRTRQLMRAAGFDEPAAVDLWTGLVTGLAAQQIANDPGGDRWLRLYDEVADMFYTHMHEKRRRG